MFCYSKEQMFDTPTLAHLHYSAQSNDCLNRSSDLYESETLWNTFKLKVDLILQQCDQQPQSTQRDILQNYSQNRNKNSLGLQ